MKEELTWTKFSNLILEGNVEALEKVDSEVPYSSLPMDFRLEELFRDHTINNKMFSYLYRKMGVSVSWEGFLNLLQQGDVNALVKANLNLSNYYFRQSILQQKIWDVVPNLVANNKLEMLQHMEENGFNFPPITIFPAIKMGQLQGAAFEWLFQKLIKNDFDSLCCISAQYGHLNLIELLIKNKKDQKLEVLSKALLEAAKNGHSHIVKYLVENNPKLLQQIKIGPKNDLLYKGCISWGNLLGCDFEQVHYLLSQLELPVIEEIADKCLVYAIKAGRLETVKYLIGEKREINSDWLLTAISNSQKEIVMYLFEEKNNKKWSSELKNWITALIEAEQKEMIKYLIDRFDIESNNMPSEYKKEAVIMLFKGLLQANHGTYSRLTFKRSTNHFLQINILIEKYFALLGYQNSEVQNYYWVALRDAVIEGDFEAIKFLIEKDCDPNHKIKGYSPVFQACLGFFNAKRDPEILSYLICHGAAFPFKELKEHNQRIETSPRLGVFMDPVFIYEAALKRIKEATLYISTPKELKKLSEALVNNKTLISLNLNFKWKLLSESDKALTEKIQLIIHKNRLAPYRQNLEKYAISIENIDDISEWFGEFFLSLPFKKILGGKEKDILAHQEIMAIYQWSIYLLAYPGTTESHRDLLKVSLRILLNNKLGGEIDFDHLVKEPTLLIWSEKDFREIYLKLQDSYPMHDWQGLTKPLTPKIYNACVLKITALLKEQKENEDAYKKIETMVGPNRSQLLLGDFIPFCTAFAEQCGKNAFISRDKLWKEYMFEFTRNKLKDFAPNICRDESSIYFSDQLLQKVALLLSYEEAWKKLNGETLPTGIKRMRAICKDFQNIDSDEALLEISKIAGEHCDKKFKTPNLEFFPKIKLPKINFIEIDSLMIKRDATIEEFYTLLKDLNNIHIEEVQKFLLVKLEKFFLEKIFPFEEEKNFIDSFTFS